MGCSSTSFQVAGRRFQVDLRAQGAGLLNAARIENQVGFRGPCRCHKSCVNLLGTKPIVKVIPMATSLRQGRVETTINGFSMVEAHGDESVLECVDVYGAISKPIN